MKKSLCLFSRKQNLILILPLLRNRTLNPVIKVSFFYFLHLVPRLNIQTQKFNILLSGVIVPVVKVSFSMC